jgi:hypothetical protein
MILKKKKKKKKDFSLMLGFFGANEIEEGYEKTKIKHKEVHI